MPIDEWVKVWFADESYTHVIPDDEPSIDAAVSRHVDSGGTRDSLIHMTANHGGQIVCRASYIMGWSLSTPETRRAEWEITAAQKEEDRENRAAVGIFEDDD